MKNSRAIKSFIFIITWITSIFIFSIPLMNKGYGFLSINTLPWFIGIFLSGVSFIMAIWLMSKK